MPHIPPTVTKIKQRLFMTVGGLYVVEELGGGGLFTPPPPPTEREPRAMDLPHGEKNETAAPPDAAAAAAQGGSHADAMEEEEHHAASGASPSMVGLGGGGGGAQPGEEGGGGGAASSAATPMTTEVVAPPPVVTGTDDEAPHRSATAGEMVVEEEQEEDEDEGKRSGGGGGKQRIYVAGKMMFFNSPGRDWRGLGRFKELEWRSDQEALPLLDKMRSLRDVEVDWDENWVYVGPHFLSCPGLDHDVDYFYQLDDEPRSGSALASVLRDEQRDFTVDEREKQVLFDNARHQIGKCDVLYARLTDQKDCFWTFTEIGIAAGLGALTSPLSSLGLLHCYMHPPPPPHLPVLRRSPDSWGPPPVWWHTQESACTSTALWSRTTPGSSPSSPSIPREHGIPRPRPPTRDSSEWAFGR
jgi:hypothetical protein